MNSPWQRNNPWKRISPWKSEAASSSLARKRQAKKCPGLTCRAPQKRERSCTSWEVTSKRSDHCKKIIEIHESSEKDSDKARSSGTEGGALQQVWVALEKAFQF